VTGSQIILPFPGRNRTFSGMKRLPISLLAVLAALLSGCAHRYDMTLTNGIRITNVSRPLLDRDQGIYTYKDVTGQSREVSAGRVVEIEPHSNKQAQGFTP
jgi:hypothetical protein